MTLSLDKSEILQKIDNTSNLSELEDIRLFFLGKKGLITSEMKSLSSLDKTQYMVKPTIIKPKLLRALTGSLNIEELILSHQRQASPMTAPGSREGITPKCPKRK